MELHSFINHKGAGGRHGAGAHLTGSRAELGAAEAPAAPLQLMGQSLAPLHPPQAPLVQHSPHSPEPHPAHRPAPPCCSSASLLTPSPSCVPDARLHLGASQCSAARGQPQLGPFFFPKTVPEPLPRAPPTRTETHIGFVKELY